MTSFRNPVVGGILPKPLPCMDIDPTTGARTGHTCENRWKEYYGDSFNCPGGCNKAAFLYPRKRRSNGDFHFHQGIDIGWDEGAHILSVTSGTVVVAENEYRPGWSYYGKVVVIKAREVPYYVLYAHCASICVAKDEEVKAGQLIATVGRTFYNKKYPTQTFRDGPHLHFEVITKLSGTAPGTETQLGEDMTRRGGTDQPRLDPLYILEKLGPWGMTKVHSATGKAMTRALADSMHDRIESSSAGGFFPLGANTHWHGGVHLPAPLGSELVAPFDATIVAARLDPDPAHAFHPGAGHSNFILLRHELSDDAYALFQGRDPADIEPPKPKPVPKPKARAVGRKSHCANLAADVVAVKHALHEHLDGGGRPYYDVADLDVPTTSTALANAIAAFQTDNVPSISPDGVVDIPGKTWTALHDGTPPAEPTEPPPENPAEPPPARPLDPKRVVYSLLMHLQPLPLTDATANDFSWLRQAKLAPNPADPAEDAALRARGDREDDLAEAKHELAGSVGAVSEHGTAATNHPDDVLWVSTRLVRFGFHPGPPSSTCDETLVTAIRELQNEHHPYFQEERNGDGRVDTTGTTLALLRKTREQLLGGSKGRGTSIDPIFLHRTTLRDELGTAKVLTNLDVKVRSGEPLWRSGQAAGTTPDGRTNTMLEQVHWELFSEHLLVATWEPPLEDLTDDLTADVPDRIIAMIDGGAPELEQDGVLEPREIQAFYASGRAQVLRRTPCRFISHWSLDPDAAAARLADMGFDPTGIAEQLRPFMWWDQARPVLPTSSFVWHYNPIEFLAEYAEHLEALRPEMRDPATHSALLVRALFDNGLPMPDAKVLLYQGIDVIRTARTGSDGIARFLGVAHGPYAARLEAPPSDMFPLESRPDETTEITIASDVPGPPLPRGSIHLIVRKHSFEIAGSVEVWLTHATAGPVTGDTTHHGKLSFEDLPHGEYLVEAGDAEPAAVALDTNSKKVTVILPPPLGMLRVKVSLDGAVARRELEILGKHGVVASALTNADGVVELELRQGHYTARVGEAKKKVYVKGNDTKTYTLELSDEQLPDGEGTLAVSVIHEDGTPAVAAMVLVSGADALEADYPSASGVAAFALPPGDYTIEVDDRSVTATVYAASTRWVQLEVSG